MIPALRWAAMRAILMFSVGSDGQSHKTVSTNHNLSEEKGEPKPASNRGPSAYQPNALPLGQTGSHFGCTSGGVMFTLCLLACQSCLCCCACVASFPYLLTPLSVDSVQALWASFYFRLSHFGSAYPFLQTVLGGKLHPKLYNC